MAAYFIFTHKVIDADKLNNDYLPKAVKSLEPYNPEILVVDQNHEVIEGDSPNTRTVVLKFDSKQQAKEWYNSPEYQDCIHLRLEAVDGGAVLCEEFDPSSV